jgi:hypothetical protein
VIDFNSVPLMIYLLIDDDTFDNFAGQLRISLGGLTIYFSVVGSTATATAKVNAGTCQFGFTDLSAELFADLISVIPGFTELAPLASVELFNR